MVRVYVRHHVKSYAEWRAAYDSYAERRRTGRVVAWEVYRGIDDPNDVTVWQDFEDIEAARAYAEAPVVGDAMRSGGVDSTPEVWFTEVADTGWHG